MNKEQTLEAIDIMIAWSNGETVEFKPKDASEWYILGDYPVWNWEHCDYRIKD